MGTPKPQAGPASTALSLAKIVRDQRDLWSAFTRKADESERPAMRRVFDAFVELEAALYAVYEKAELDGVSGKGGDRG